MRLAMMRGLAMKRVLSKTWQERDSMVRFLVIDDDAHLTQGICDILGLDFSDCLALAAYNGKAGLELARKYQPDLIICNWWMPVMDGHEMLRNLHLDSKLRSIPFLLTSASPPKCVAWLQSEFGLDVKKHFIMLPMDAEDLLDMVRVLLRESDRKQEWHEKYEPLKLYPIEEGGQRLFTSK
jgi:CheY-like chemotaxis protein